MTTTDIISAIGVLLILIPFFLATFDMLSDKSRIYFGLNFVGGVMAFWGNVLLVSVPFAVLEGTWAVVALIGLIRTIPITK